jgi:CPA1 family monovalent cation:H+ antiporter
MPSETIFILLFIVATAVAIAVRRLHIPYTVGLVIAGLLLGFIHALPMVLVLSLPQDFLHRDLLISITFGVVIISILLQGLTISPLLHWLGLATAANKRIEMEVERGRIRAANAALTNLEHLSNTP